MGLMKRAGRHAPAVSVVVPTLNGMPEFEPAMHAVRRQRFDGEVEIVVVDSGSTDGTLDVAARYADVLLHVERDAFDHGDTRNLAIARASAPFVAILSQDAEPVGDDWLASLVAPLRADPAVAAVCGRCLPREGMDPLLARGVEGDLNFSTQRREVRVDDREAFASLSPYEQRLHLNFHDVGSCLRRTVWERMPFPRTAFGEDLMWARAAVENGHTLVYEPAASVLHAHDYTPRELLHRTRLDGRLNRRLLDRRPIEKLRHVGVMVGRNVAADWRYLRDRGVAAADRLRALPRSVALQSATFWGLYRGGCEARHRPQPRIPSPSRPLRVLFVVHGFPPFDVAGTEVHTHAVARGMQARGHAVAVFHRVSALDRPAYEVTRDTFDELTVYRMANDFAYNGIGETVENPRVEAAFRDVLERERPDLVHFQHCLHTSVSLISLCDARGIATTVTLNDFWFICPTVQLILPNRSLCRPSRAGIACVGCARREGTGVRAIGRAVSASGPIARAGVGALRRLAPRVPALRRDVVRDTIALADRPKTVLGHLRRAGRVLAPSRFLRGFYVEFGLDPEQIIYQRYGIDVAACGDGSKSARTGPLRVGFIGSFVWYKGVHVLVDAFTRLRPDEAVLTIWGNESSPPEVRDYAQDCRARAGDAPVTFAGPLRREDLAAAHRDIDVLVVPSIWYENSPLVILEAQAARTPVVTSDLGGMAELVRDRVDGRHFRRGDADSLAGVLRELAADPDAVGRLRDAIRRPKDVATHLDELELLYRQLTSIARPLSGTIPFWSVDGRDWTGTEGPVEPQGEGLALLRPDGGNGTRVHYRLSAPAAGAARLVVTTRVLPAEPDVVLAGRLRVDDAVVGEIPPHRCENGRGRVVEHAFVHALEAGERTLTVEAGPGAAFLRIERIAIFHAETSAVGC